MAVNCPVLVGETGSFWAETTTVHLPLKGEPVGIIMSKVLVGLAAVRVKETGLAIVGSPLAGSSVADT